MPLHDSHSASQNGILVLGDQVDIRTITELYAKLRALLATGDPIIVDVSRVASIDTAGVQLLLCLHHELQTRRCGSIRGQSIAIEKAFRTLGLGPFSRAGMTSVS